MNHYLAVQAAKAHLDFVVKQHNIPLAVVLHKLGIATDYTVAVQWGETLERVVGQSTMWHIRQILMNACEDIRSHRYSMKEVKDPMGGKIRKVCSTVARDATRAFKEFAGHTYQVGAVDCSFYSSEFTEPTASATWSGSRFGNWTFQVHLHKSWAAKVHRDGNATFNVSGHKVFVIDAEPVRFKESGVRMELLTAFGCRSESAVNREIKELEERIAEVPQDERDDPELRGYFDELNDRHQTLMGQHDSGHRMINAPHIHYLYLCTSEYQRDLDGNYLKGIGSTPEQAFKLMERRVRDTFVKELSV